MNGNRCVHGTVSFNGALSPKIGGIGPELSDGLGGRELITTVIVALRVVSPDT